MILLIGGEKGGTGKTTLATNLAATRARSGADVLLVDTDKQASASLWASLRSEIPQVPRVPCVQVFGKNVSREVADLADRYGDIIIDAGGRDSVELRSAMVVADRLFIPVQASQFDVWTLEAMDELVAQAASINAGLRADVIINRASPHPLVHEAEDAAAFLADFAHVGFSGVTVRDRIAYRRAASLGLAVSEVADPDPKAVAEIASCFTFVFGEHPVVAT